MALLIDVAELDRWEVIKVLYAEGKTFPEMLPVLVQLGHVECKNDHRTRKGRDGASVCATCEMTISQEWRRGLARLSATEAVADEVMGQWLEAHEFIAKTCRTNAVKIDRTTNTVTAADGTTTTTVHEVTRVDRGLLRLLSETQDKILRATGVDIDDPDALAHVPRSKVRVNRSTGTGAGRGDGAVN